MEEVGLTGRRPRRLLSALAAGALLAACRSGDGRPAQVSLTAGGVAEIRSAVAERHGSPVLLNFWAVWCDPCVEELPDLATIETKFASSRLRVVGVSCDLLVEEDSTSLRAKVSETLERSGVHYANVLYAGDQDPLMESFDLPGPIPYTILYSAEGKELKRWTGRLPMAELEGALKEM